MKLLTALFLFSFTSVASAQLCEVYGISDSPQSLDCSFDTQKVALRCDKGTYRLNETVVKVAFHMEVEEGPVPLVFKTDDSTLTILINSNTDITAEYEQSKADTLIGKCR